MASAAEGSDGWTRDRSSPLARYRKLKPRPGQSGEEVAKHQRGRIHAATIDLAYEKGYAGLTVTGIARAAGVSNRTFYENFNDKDDCFVSTYDLIVRHTAREILAARQREHGWRAKLQAGFVAFVQEVAEQPEAAHLALVEAFSARPAYARMRHTLGLFEALVAESFTGRADGLEPEPLVVKGIVAGGNRVVRARLLAGEQGDLVKDADGLMQWALSLFSEEADKVAPNSLPDAAGLPSSPGIVGNGWKVPRGEAWLGDERTMILTAVAELAAEEGYEALTVPRIRAAAGISRRRFDEHFEGVIDCFLAALEMLLARVLADARAACLSAGGWQSGIDRAVATICREIAADPLLVRLLFFELYVPGGQTVRWRADLIANLSSFLRAHAPAEQRPSELAAEASVAAAWAVLHEYAVGGRAADLPQVAGIISYLLVAPSIGAEAAVEGIRARRIPQGSEDRLAPPRAEQLT